LVCVYIYIYIYMYIYIYIHVHMYVSLQFYFKYCLSFENVVAINVSRKSDTHRTNSKQHYRTFLIELDRIVSKCKFWYNSDLSDINQISVYSSIFYFTFSCVNTSKISRLFCVISIYKKQNYIFTHLRKFLIILDLLTLFFLQLFAYYFFTIICVLFYYYFAS